jgi:hypothetical protein
MLNNDVSDFRNNLALKQILNSVSSATFVVMQCISTHCATFGIFSLMMLKDSLIEMIDNRMKSIETETSTIEQATKLYAQFNAWKKTQHSQVIRIDRNLN